MCMPGVRGKEARIVKENRRIAGTGSDRARGVALSLQLACFTAIGVAFVKHGLL